MKRLLAACVIFAVATAPAAAASVFEDALSPRRGDMPACTLGGGVEPVVGGVTGDLLSGRSGDAAGIESQRPRYSPLREGLASMLLPGLGQLRMGRTLRARVFFGLEGAAWIAIGGFLWQGYARENAYEDYAVAFAGVSGTSHSDDYYETIGKFLSNDGPGGYNEYVRREARDLYYPNLDAMNVYFDQESITGADAWRWESTTTFNRYNHLYDGSRAAYRNALYAGIFAMALRVVSSVDAIRLARGSGDNEPSGGESVSMSVRHRPGGFLLSFTKPF